MNLKAKPELDTAFCVHWMGNKKAKWCRQCATKGTPCLALWEAVKTLAAQNLVLVNPKNANRYQLEPPKRSHLHIYIQTLQGKHAHFALPIEDLLYVAKTGKGGMYETPSQTKQEPFVGLILEQIIKNPVDTKLVKAVRAVPPQSK